MKKFKPSDLFWVNLVPITFIICGTIMAINNTPYWGWLIFLGAITGKTLKETEDNKN